MPKSDSDVTENASITSDDEQMDPVTLPGSRRAVLSPTAESSEGKHRSPVEMPPTGDATNKLASSPSNSSAAARLKASALKVTYLHKSSTQLADPFDGPGAEPGIDPRQPHVAEHYYSLIHEDCKAQIIDYSDTRVTFVKADNQGLVRLLDSPRADKPAWAKVRWINIGGISWDIVSALALKYELHPLSVEDVLQDRRTTLSKADYYVRHLFITTLCHTLRPYSDDDAGEDVEPADSGRPISPRGNMEEQQISGLGRPIPMMSSDARGTRPTGLHSRSRRTDHREPSAHMRGEGRDKEEKAPNDDLDWITDDISNPDPSQSPAKPAPAIQISAPEEQTSSLPPRASRDRLATKLAIVNDLKKGRRVELDVRPLYLFLIRDGTVISFYRKDEHASVFGLPIIDRLRESHTLLRSSADPSMLLQAILDYVVDDAMQVVDRYQEQITRLERQAFMKPGMTLLPDLHILSGDLTLYKRTLAPMRSLVYGLRRYDLDRYKAVVGSYAPGTRSEDIKGFMSHQSKVYLADVVDHMDYILASMDMFSNVAENLITLTFNTISYQTNETTRRLTMTTIIFFPPFFLTGYFGMNFRHGTFWAVRHSDLFFWEVAIPLIVFVICLFLWSDFVRFQHFVSKRMHEHRLQKLQMEYKRK